MNNIGRWCLSPESVVKYDRLNLHDQSNVKEKKVTDKFIEAIKKTGAPICVGLDPKMSFLPKTIADRTFNEMGVSVEAAAEAFLKYNKAVIDAVKDLVPSVKPQIAMYEELGLPGLKCYQDTVKYARDAGLIVIGDVKRGDIGSTCASYANAHLGTADLTFGARVVREETFATDYATVNPYMGSDGINEFLSVGREFDRGIFVLVKTSNPSSAEFQDLDTGGEKLYERVARKVSEWGQDSIGRCGYSDVGAVVGATYPEVGRRLRELMPATLFLVPGYGAQGASAADLKDYFDKDGIGAVVNSSRGIIAAYKKEEYAKFGDDGFADAARAATEDMIKDLRENAGVYH